MASNSSKKPDVRALIESQLRGPKHSFARVRRQLDRLADENDPQILSDFVALWSDDDEATRFWAMAYALPMLYDGLQVRDLDARLEPLLVDPKPANRQMAMRICAMQGSAISLRLLEFIAANLLDTRVNTHHEAMRTLGALGNAAVPYLPNIIRALSSEDTRWYASITLKRLAAHVPVELRGEVERLAHENPDPLVRSQLAVAVKKWQGTEPP